MSDIGKMKYQFSDLENLGADDLFTFIDNIPSDDESVVSDGDDEIDEVENVDRNHNDFFDINAMEIIFEDSVRPSEDNSDWDTDDDMPLSILQAKLKKAKTVWTRNTQHCVKVKKTFCEPTGPNIPDELETPTDVFLYLFTQELIDHIVFQTNLYSLQKAGGAQMFTQTTSSEVKAFISANLLMGIKKLPSYRDYWSSQIELRDSYISTLISRDRFSWLLSNIHLNDNSMQPARNSPNFDKLYKIRPLLDTLGRTFLESYRPRENQSIDESMIKFKGRSSLRQYMPMKPVKRGYKVWVRADETGYICQFQIYTGKVADAAEKNLGARVVKDLTRSLVAKGHKVYFDNFFNSVQLENDLLEECIYACGTARKGRRDMPVDLKDDKHLQRGDSDFRISTNGIVCLKWKDRKSVLFLSNHHNPSQATTVNRKEKDGTRNNVNCPQLVKDYNQHMGYVDKMDMLKKLYEVSRKSKKWWHRILFYFIDLTVINAYILFKERMPDTTLNLKHFRLGVAVGLVGCDPGVVKKGRKSSTQPTPLNNFKRTVPYEIRYDKCCHMPVHGKPRRCSLCSTRKEPHRSSWSCSTCNVGLCLSDKKNCFVRFHQK